MSFIHWQGILRFLNARRIFLTVAWLVFFAALWFALEFNFLARQRLGQLEESGVALDRRSHESKQVEALNSLVVGATNMSESATRFYTDHLANLEESDRVPVDLLRSGAQIVSETRLRIATAEGAIAGVFASHPLANDAVVLRSRLQRINASMGILDSFFGNYSVLGPALAIRQLRAAGALIGADSVDALSSRLRAWDENAAATTKVSSAEGERHAAWTLFLTRLWSSAFAIVYCVAFLTVLFFSRWHLGDPYRRAA
jgi:hypothetical protein